MTLHVLSDVGREEFEYASHVAKRLYRVAVAGSFAVGDVVVFDGGKGDIPNVYFKCVREDGGLDGLKIGYSVFTFAKLEEVG